MIEVEPLDRAWDFLCCLCLFVCLLVSMFVCLGEGRGRAIRGNP